MSGRHKQTNTQSNLSKTQHEEIENAFQLFDSDKSGYLDKHELHAALKSLGFEMRRSEVASLVVENDPDNKGGIDRKTFHRIAEDYVLNRNPISEVKKSFQRFSQSGEIDFKCLRKIAKECGIIITDEKLHQMIEEFDEDGDGIIKEQDFVQIFAPIKK